jgi:hypothetical protein
MLMECPSLALNEFSRQAGNRDPQTFSEVWRLAPLPLLVFSNDVLAALEQRAHRLLPANRIPTTALPF